MTEMHVSVERLTVRQNVLGLLRQYQNDGYDPNDVILGVADAMSLFIWHNEPGPTTQYADQGSVEAREKTDD